MIATYLSNGLKGDHKSTLAVGSRLCGTASGGVDVNTFLDQAFSIIATGGERAVAFRFVANIINTSHFHEVEKRILNFNLVARLPAFAESIKSLDEAMSYMKFLDAIYLNPSNELQASLNTIEASLIGAACRICSNELLLDYGFSIMQLVMHSSGRTTITGNNLKSIRALCFRHIGNSCFIEQAADVLALSFALESSDQWNVHWRSMLCQCIRLLQEIDINVSIDKSLLAGNPLQVPCDWKGVTGSKKTVEVERLFHGCTATLSRMLSNGCSAGPVSPDMSVFVSLISTVLSMNVPSPSNDPKCVVVNKQGVASVDVFAISNYMKCHCMQLLDELLSTMAPSLLRFAASLCRPISVLISSCDLMQSCPALAVPSLSCIGRAARCFPSLVARMPWTVTGGVLQLLQRVISAMTLSPANVVTEQLLVSQSHGHLSRGSSSPSASFAPSTTLAVIGCVEALLLSCSPMLSASAREMIETAVGQALSCLCKGVLSAQVTDRRMKRAQCEPLRHDVCLQLAVLSLALTEVTASPNNGIMSGNVVMLRQAALCLRQQGQTYDQATRVLLTVDVMLHPTAVLLPALPLVTLAKAHLKKLEDCNNTADDTGNETQLSSTHQVDNKASRRHGDDDHSRVASVNRVECATGEEIDGAAGKRQRTEQAVNVACNSKATAPAQPAFQFDQVESKPMSNVLNNDEDDDDSIPDIVDE